MKQEMSAGRLQYQRTFTYNNKVLIGSNWYEDRQHYVKKIHKHKSLVNDSYTEKKLITDPNTYWNCKLLGEGIDNAELFCHDKKYYENFATTNDLVYNWLPKCKPKKKEYCTIKLHFVPETDLAKGYGNVTSFGLKEAKKLTWNYQKLTEPSSWTTENRDNYLVPKPEDYTKKRLANLKEMSTALTLLPVVPDFPLDVKKRPYPHFFY